MKRHKVLLVYPLAGFTGGFVKHAPLSLLYAAINLVKNNIDVEIFDARLYPLSWKEELKKRVSNETLMVGVSVMTGQPIHHAKEIGRFVNSIDPEVHIVWGGPHTTSAPLTCFQEDSVDYVISGYAVDSFYEYITKVSAGEEPYEVEGVYFREKFRDLNSPIVEQPAKKAFEFVDYKDIPYELIPDYSIYGQLEQERLIFSMYSVMGCPYKCTFCSSPAQYREYGKTWVPIEVMQVVDHVEYVYKTYGANYIYFIDDDSFVNLKHVEGIIDEINRREIKIGLGFRGARINEIKRMKPEFLEKLALAGTDIMHIGAESGSDRLLKMMKKNCKAEEIIECNKKLAGTPIKAAYNFIAGMPTETLEELEMTTDLMFRLVEDNPDCIIFNPNKYRPLPGTEMCDQVIEEYGYKPPVDLDDFMNYAVEQDWSSPWYEEGMESYIRMMLVCSYFIDDKVIKLTSGKTIFYKVLRWAAMIYGPVARWRMRNGYSKFLVEYYLYRAATYLINIRNNRIEVKTSQEMGEKNNLAIKEASRKRIQRNQDEIRSAVVAEDDSVTDMSEVQDAIDCVDLLEDDENTVEGQKVKVQVTV